MTPLALDAPQTLVVALAAILVGRWITRRVPALEAANVPSVIYGGVLFAAVFAIARAAGAVEVRFANDLRDVLLPVYFATIGLTAKLAALRSGGRPLFVVCAFTVGLLVMQNVIGLIGARVFDLHPFMGLLAGSIPFVGGPGTAVAWGKEGEALGVVGATEVGLACATIGVVVGGLAAAPLTGWLVRRHALAPVATRLAVTIDTPAPPLHAVDTASTPVSHPRGDAGSPALTLDRAIDALIVLALCVVVGRLLHAAVTAAGITVPGFLTAMLVAVVLTNIADVLRIPTATRAIDLFGELALELFLAMSLMSVQLWMLAALAGPIAVISAVQIVTTCAVCAWVLFAWLGRSYDAAVTVGGVIGYGLSSMPVAMATMDRVTARHGPSPRAVLTISLAGAIFVDVVNAMLIRAFMALPGLH
ncbi:MAG: sodium/glutamate symporter [Burkholderiales bacterium]|nr:sodium/glutamate symporter [Burkholderiales bacterium]